MPAKMLAPSVPVRRAAWKPCWRQRISDATIEVRDSPSSRPISNAAASDTSSRPSGHDDPDLVGGVGQRQPVRGLVRRVREQRAAVPRADLVAAAQPVRQAHVPGLDDLQRQPADGGLAGLRVVPGVGLAGGAEQPGVEPLHQRLEGLVARRW